MGMLSLHGYGRGKYDVNSNIPISYLTMPTIEKIGNVENYPDIPLNNLKTSNGFLYATTTEGENMVFHKYCDFKLVWKKTISLHYTDFQGYTVDNNDNIIICSKTKVYKKDKNCEPIWEKSIKNLSVTMYSLTFDGENNIYLPSNGKILKITNDGSDVISSEYIGSMLMLGYTDDNLFCIGYNNTCDSFVLDKNLKKIFTFRVTVNVTNQPAFSHKCMFFIESDGQYNNISMVNNGRISKLDNINLGIGDDVCFASEKKSPIFYLASNGCIRCYAGISKDNDKGGLLCFYQESDYYHSNSYIMILKNGQIQTMFNRNVIKFKITQKIVN